MGGLSPRKTHYFENVVKVSQDNIVLSEDLKQKINSGFSVGLLRGGAFKNEDEVIRELQPKSVMTFFDDLCEEVKKYYEV